MKTASPEIFDLAPKDLPWKTGPSYTPSESIDCSKFKVFLTRMVSVARSCEIGVAFDGVEGI